MPTKESPENCFARSALPWFVAGGALVLFLATLNHWVRLASLPYVAEVAGWDWSLPKQAPLFFLLTYPFQWLPTAWQPIGLNVFAALCSALTLALLVRSVSLLPHDRTHEQRQRERSEFSLLSLKASWLPPLFAALVCGLELTFWEHSTAATSESLNLLLFAYVIRCLLEWRIDPRHGWMDRAAFVFGLGMANDWGMVGFLPAFLVAVVWIKGKLFFEPDGLARMILWGMAGGSLYVFLPLVSVVKGEGLGFWEVLRQNLALQKAMLVDQPALRSRALVLSLTSVLPVLIMGIRWPTSFGDTSAAGTKMTNLMFRVMHVLFLGACLLVAFDFRFSPRRVGFGIPFLTFYYLGALSIGYFSGYVLLVFGESRGKAWHKTTPLGLFAGRIVRSIVWAAAIAVPAALVYFNLPKITAENGKDLEELARLTSQNLPKENSFVLSDDARSLLLVEGELTKRGDQHKYVMIFTKALPVPFYQRRLEEANPGRWKRLTPSEGQNVLEPLALLDAFTDLSRTNHIPIVYLHPSFGYYFERFYSEPRGMNLRLNLYATNDFFPPKLSEAVLAENTGFWTAATPLIENVGRRVNDDNPDAGFAARYYSRALNDWGVELQRHDRTADAGRFFRLAVALSTNNLPAQVNLEFNKSLAAGKAKTPEFGAGEEKLGNFYRQWDSLLADNGRFDEPGYCFAIGQKFSSQSLYRQSAIYFQRAADLAPNSIEPRLFLGNTFLLGRLPEKALELVAKTRAEKTDWPLTNQLELVRLEASAYYGKAETEKAEKIVLEARSRHPDDPGLLDTLLQMYARSQDWTNALRALEEPLKKNPEAPALLMARANVFLQMKRYDDAIRTLDQIVTKNPGSIEAGVGKGVVYLQAKDFDKAIIEFESVLRRDPQNVDALLSESAAYLEKQTYDRALDPLDQVLKMQPFNWAALRNRAIANLKLERYEAAQRDYEQLLKLLPNYHPAFFGLGQIAYAKKDRANAVRNYELYLKFLPESSSTELADEKKMVMNRLQELKTANH